MIPQIFLKNQGYCSNEGCMMGVQEQCIDHAPGSYYVESGFFDNNLSVFFIKNDMISIFGFENICNIFDQSDVSFSCYFCATQELFHNINEINYINDMLKYLINNINYSIDLIDIEVNMNDSERIS
jgi:hypothetical protein